MVELYSFFGRTSIYGLVNYSYFVVYVFVGVN